MSSADLEQQQQQPAYLVGAYSTKKRLASLARPVGPPIRVDVQPDHITVRTYYAAATVGGTDTIVRPGDCCTVRRPSAGDAVVARIDALYVETVAAPLHAVDDAGSASQQQQQHQHQPCASCSTSTSGFYADAAFVYRSTAPAAGVTVDLVPSSLLEGPLPGGRFLLDAVIGACRLRSFGERSAVALCAMAAKSALPTYWAPVMPPPHVPATVDGAHLRRLSLYVQFGFMLHECARFAVPIQRLQAGAESECVRTLRAQHVRPALRAMCPSAEVAAALDRAAWCGALDAEPAGASRCAACRVECELRSPNDRAIARSTAAPPRGERAIVQSAIAQSASVAVIHRCCECDAAIALGVGDLYAHVQRCIATYAVAARTTASSSSSSSGLSPIVIDTWFTTLVGLVAPLDARPQKRGAAAEERQY